MEKLSQFRLRPAGIPKGGFTFGIPSLKDVHSYAKMQIARAKKGDWERQMERRSALPYTTEDVEPELPDHEDVADRNSEYDEKPVCPSQLPLEDTQSVKSRDQDSELQPQVTTDLTGFLELTREGEQVGVSDGFDEGVSTLASDDPIKSKDDHQSHDTDNFTVKSQEKVEDTGDEASGSSCESSLSDSVPASTPRSTPSKSSSSETTPVSTPNSSASATPTVLDPLCYFMAKASLHSSASNSSLRVTIPKAYTFSMSTEPKCHYDSMAQFQAGTGRRGPSGFKRKRQDLGFKPDEVIKKGALHTTTLDAVCKLKGDIHEIFEEKHWTDCPHQVYEILRPALMLATKLLSTSQCLQHFQTAWKGNREYCYETSFRKRKTCYRIMEDVPLTPKSIRALKQHINAMAGTITFQFLDSRITNAPDHANRYFATAQMVPCNHSSCSISAGLQTTKLQTTIISMHPDFYIQAQKLCRLQYPDPAQVLRFQFFFAVNLMHEFAHAFEIACSPEETTIGSEVHMYDNLEAESGRQWETNVFGGFVTAINARADSLHGLCVMEWPEPGLRNLSRLGLTDIWTVPMSFIQDMFLESFWQDLRKKGINDKSLLNVPRTGATSVGVASFTTAKFEEVLVDREMGCLEVALREVEGGIQCPVIDSDEEERVRRKKRKVYVHPTWIKSIGRRGGLP